MSNKLRFALLTYTSQQLPGPRDAQHIDNQEQIGQIIDWHWIFGIDYQEDSIVPLRDVGEQVHADNCQARGELARIWMRPQEGDTIPQCESERNTGEDYYGYAIVTRKQGSQRDKKSVNQQSKSTLGADTSLNLGMLRNFIFG